METLDLLAHITSLTEAKFEYIHDQIIPKEDSKPLPQDVIDYILRPDFDLLTFQQKSLFQMATSLNHTEILTELYNIIWQQINHSEYRTYVEGLKIQTKSLGFFRIPDLTITLLNDREFTPSGALKNPISIIEVLSPATEKKDRNEKKEEYQRITNLQEYILIAQDSYKVEQYLRTGKTSWIVKVYDSADQTCILTVGVKIQLSKLYQSVKFDKI